MFWFNRLRTILRDPAVLQVPVLSAASRLADAATLCRFDRNPGSYALRQLRPTARDNFCRWFMLPAPVFYAEDPDGGVLLADPQWPVKGLLGRLRPFVAISGVTDSAGKTLTEAFSVVSGKCEITGMAGKLMGAKMVLTGLVFREEDGRLRVDDRSTPLNSQQDTAMQLLMVRTLEVLAIGLEEIRIFTRPVRNKAYEGLHYTWYAPGIYQRIHSFQTQAINQGAA